MAKKSRVSGILLVAWFSGFCVLPEAFALAGPEKNASNADTAARVREVMATAVRTPSATVALTTIDDTGMDILISPLGKEPVTLRFIPNGDGTLRPDFNQALRPAYYGVPLPQVAAVAPKVMQPWTEFAARTPHDNASVFVVNSGLVLIGLYRQGAPIGMYFALTPDAAQVGGEGEEGPAAMMQHVALKVQICNSLLHACQNHTTENWVHACGYWLQFCQQP